MYGGVPPSVPQFSSFFVQDALLRREIFFRICKRCVCICCSCRIHAAPLYCIEMDFTPRTCAEGAYIVYAVPAVLHNAHLQSWVDFFSSTETRASLLQLLCFVQFNKCREYHSLGSDGVCTPMGPRAFFSFCFFAGKKILQLLQRRGWLDERKERLQKNERNLKGFLEHQRTLHAK